ncbi:MAG: alpha/beta fold hydrolase [Gemmatimonadota bacterium]
MIRRASLLALFGILAGALPAGAQDLGGCWAGTMAQGANLVRGAFEFSDVGGSWSGAIHRMGANPSSDPFSAVTMLGASVSTTFPSTLGTGSATFQGMIEGDALTGSIQSAGQSIPVSFFRVDLAVPDPALDLLGYWNGGLYQGGALVLRLGFEFAPAPCGQVHASMDSPDQGAENIPVSSISLSRDTLAFEIASASGAFRGTVSAGRDSIAGTWTQAGSSIQMRLARGDGPVSFARPQDPVPPFPYEEVEVTYENPNDGTRFAGTLTVPEGEGPFPAALMITGSGAQDRNEALMGHRPFLVIADHLTRRGIAVLRVDDRGVGGSTGNVMEATIRDNIGDALAAVAFLRERPEIDPDRVGLIGHSEGGWVAPGVAADTEDVAFLVMLAGPSVSGREILLAQSRAIMEASGATQFEEGLTINRIGIDAAASETTVERAREAVHRAVEEAIAGLPPEEGSALRAVWEAETVQSNMEAGLPTMVSPWYRNLVVYDPIDTLENLEIPALALYGERDLQVPPTQSVPILEDAWDDHPDATIHVFPGLNHLFQHAETGLMAEYATIEETFAPEALEMIGRWIEERFVDGR